MPDTGRSESRGAVALAIFLAGAGTMHFVAPRFYDAMIPRELPGEPRAWTYGSGVAELGCAAAVAHPRTRRLGGLLSALLFAGVFPGNVKMAVDTHRAGRSFPQRLATLLRLPLQIPLVRWALRVRAGASG